MKQLLFLFSLQILISFTAGAYSIERSDKLTIVKFSKEDFPQSRIDDDIGWQMDCPVKTPGFAMPNSFDAELEIVVALAGQWEGLFKNPSEAFDHHLATLELSFTDKFGSSQFLPKMIRPAHLGNVPDLFAETTDNRFDLYGGNLKERTTIKHGHFRLDAGAKDLSVGICEIAPTTSFEIHEIQFRFRPVD